MAISTDNQLAQQTAFIKTRIRLENKFKASANIFFWIGGLSQLNSATRLLGISWLFFAGLGVTQIVDGASMGFTKQLGELSGLSGVTIRIIALLVDIVVVSIFFVFGYFSRKGHKWSFITGMILYGLDAIIFLLFGLFLGLGFHLLMFWGLYQGLSALMKMEKIQLGDISVFLPQTSGELQATKQTNRILFILLLLAVLGPFFIFITLLIPHLRG
jgi:hypothetical protein